MTTRRGFTLIEVLLGLVLLALVLSLIQGVYAGAIRSRDRARAQTEGVHQAALVLQRLADELASAAQGTDTAFTLDEGPDRNSRLRFTTVLPGLMPEKTEDTGPPGETYAALSYQVEEGEGGVRRLVRSDSRLADEASSSPAESDTVIEDVTRFRVLVSADGKTWEDAWEGGGEAGLPKVASVEVGWQTRSGREKPQEHLLRTTTPLYGANK